MSEVIRPTFLRFPKRMIKVYKMTGVARTYYSYGKVSDLADTFGNVCLFAASRCPRQVTSTAINAPLHNGHYVKT